MLTAQEILEWNDEGTARPLLDVRGLVKHFATRSGLLGHRRGVVRAVDGVSFQVLAGETLGIVGEPGCGKSTVARLLSKLIDADAGTISLGGEPAGAAALPLAAYQAHVRMVSQDSHAAPNPRLTVEKAIRSGPVAHGVPARDASARARSLMSRVGLDPDRFASRYPHELSAGLRRRVGIARALALEPRLLILDDVAPRGDTDTDTEMLSLLRGLKDELGLTYLVTSRDREAVRAMADRVMVMHLGQVVEIGPAAGGRHLIRAP